MQRFFGEDEEPWEFPLFTPHVNLAETNENYEVTAELPGLKPEEVNVELREGSLWISGEKKEEKEEKGKTFHKIERRSGEFRRVIPLAAPVNDSEVKATFEHGVLKITVPKTEQAKPKKIEVKG